MKKDDKKNAGVGCLIFVGLCIAVGLCGRNSDKPVDEKAKPNKIHIKKAEYGEKWPFRFPEAVLSCKNDAVIVSFGDAMSFGLNGVAIQNGYEDIAVKYNGKSVMWLDDPKNPGLKISIGPMITRGLKLCEK